MNPPEDLQTTPLYDHHVGLQARMVPFGGWSMPVQYTGIIEEYWQCRKSAALFDICHMGEIILEGDKAIDALEKLITCPFKDLAVKRCRYGLMLNTAGGVIDDLITFRLSEKRFLLVVNAANTQKDFEHIKKVIGSDVWCEDISLQTGKLDLQGPWARDVLAKLCPDIARLKYFQFDEFSLLGETCWISRTGYTGELGYEIFYPWAKTKILWQKILENDKVKPAGLGARDILRIEMAYSLYGHEISDDVTPLAAGLEGFVDFQKEFIGKNALLQQQQDAPTQQAICFISGDRRSPRQGHKIFSSDKGMVGEVASGTFSPSLEKGIGLGRITAPKKSIGETVYFGSSGRCSPAVLVQKPFYKNGSLKG